MIVAILITGFGVATVVAQSYANRSARAFAADLSARTGRAVRVGEVDVTWLRGVGAVVHGVEIGGDPRVPDEPSPAVRVERARVRVAFWRSVLTLGKRARVKEISVDGVTAHVVRYRDGTLNLQSIAQKLGGPQQPEEARPLDDATRARLRGARLEHLAVRDARLVFVDLAQKGARAEIRDLDVEVRGASLAAPFEAHVSAAVLAASKNLDVSARFGASRDTPEGVAPPPLQRATVKLARTELAPLAPFLAAMAVPGMGQLAQGSLAIDLTAELGAAAPGGHGPTVAQGAVALEGARMAEGERFDARLAVDVRGDAEVGDVEIRKLVATLGDMAIEARGKLLGLQKRPRFESFDVRSRGLDFDRLRAYYPALDQATGMLLGGPFAVVAQADGRGGAQGFSARVDLSDASLEIPGQLRKPAGTPLFVEAQGRADGETVRADRVLLAFGDARVRGQGVLGPAKARGARPFNGTVESDPVAVRPLASLLSPKQAAGLPDVTVAVRASARGVTGRPDSIAVDVQRFSLTGGKSDLTGSATVANLDRPRFTLDARSSYLDLDDLLPASTPRSPASKDQPRAAARPARARSTEPSALAGVSGRAKLAVARGRAQGIEYRDLQADLALAAGRLRAHALEVGAFGGRFSGAGTELPVATELAAAAPFVLKGRVSGMDAAAILARFAGVERVVDGKLDAEVDLGGAGTTPEALAASLAGRLRGKIGAAELQAASLLEPIAAGVRQATRVPGLAKLLGGAEGRLTALGDRRLGDLGGVVRFVNGAMEIAEPLKARTPHGTLELGGKVFLNGRADLTGSLLLEPETASALAGGKLQLTEAVPVRLRITGPVTSPRVTPAELDGLARAYATAFARSGAGQAVENVARERGRELLDRAKVPEAARENTEKAREAAGRRLRGLLRR